MKKVSLEKATTTDAESIFDIQVKAFLPLLEKYKDYNTSPGNESIDRVISRITNPQAISWELATILEEERNCYLYKKMGYIQTAEKRKINESTTLVFL